MLWGLMSPLSKLLMACGLVTPLVVTDLRIAGAMILFWLLSWVTPAEHVNHRDQLHLLGAALLAIVFNQGSFIFGVSMTSPGDASIITTSMPLWAMVLAALILKEPVTGKKVLGIAAGAAGALLLIIGSRGGSEQAAGAGNHAIWGDLLVLTAQLSYALYIVIYKDFVGRYSTATIMKWMFTYSFICLLPVSARGLAATPWSLLSMTDWGCLAFIIVGGTFLSYLLVVVGQRYLRPTVAGMYNYVQPVVACTVAVCLGMDELTWIKGVAVLLIFGGVYLVTISRTRHEVEQYEAAKGSPATNEDETT